MPAASLTRENPLRNLGFSRAIFASMVREAKFRGVQPFLGALLPKVSGACRGGSADAVPIVNQQIHAMADTEGVVYVDLYQAFGSNFTQYIGVDGLHPNTAGYQKIAEVFMSIVTR